MKSMLKAPGTELWELKCGKTDFKFCFQIQPPRSAKAAGGAGIAGALAGAGGASMFAPWQERMLRELQLEGPGQGRTLVHFSAQRKHLSWKSGVISVVSDKLRLGLIWNCGRVEAPSPGAKLEVLVTRNPRQPVDPRLLAGLRVLYAARALQSSTSQFNLRRILSMKR
jgi:hypothetical protein